MNWLAMNTENPKAVNTVYNTAYGENTTLNQLVGYLKELLGFTTPGLLTWILFTALSGRRYSTFSGPLSIKPGSLLGYDPRFNMKQGLREAGPNGIGRI